MLSVATFFLEITIWLPPFSHWLKFKVCHSERKGSLWRKNRNIRKSLVIFSAKQKIIFTLFDNRKLVIISKFTLFRVKKEMQHDQKIEELWENFSHESNTFHFIWKKKIFYGRNFLGQIIQFVDFACICGNPMNIALKIKKYQKHTVTF